MDEKVKKKKSRVEESSLGSSLETNKRKKEKHKEIKKQHGTYKTFDPNGIVEGNCIGDACDGQACSIAGKFMRNREEEGDISQRKKKKGARESEVVNGNTADDNVEEIFNENQNSKMKKRKNRDDLLTGMQEMVGSKPSKKGKMTEKNDLKNNEGDPPLNIIIAGNANTHSLVNKVDGKGKMEKKKLSEKSNTMVEGYNSNAVNHSIVAEEGQGKEMEKVLGKKKKKNQDEECKTNEGDDDQGKEMMETKKKLSDKSKKNEIEGNEGNQHLAKGIEGEDDDQGRKTKEWKLSDKSKSKESYEVDDQGKKLKIKKKLSDKSKCKEKNEIKSNEGDQHLAKGIEGEDDDKEKKMKVRKLSGKSKNKESEGVDDQGKKMKIKKKTKAGTDSPDSAPGGTSKPKRVTFSDQVDVCCDGLIRGKRFTPEENETLKQAVLDYIEDHGLGDQGLDMILHCRFHPEVKHCWKDIGKALPHRPVSSVYYRAHILFNRDSKRKWTPEELDFVRKVQKQHGSDWKAIAEALGKNRFHVKDAWRRLKFTESKRGAWSQEEYQQLFDLVNLDLRVRSLEDHRKTKHGMLRDNISWEAIAGKLATKNSSRSCKKWYEHLTSPMVAQGMWSDTDDYRLINALFDLDACCMEEVDWDNLLEHRDGDLCRKRWDQMVRYIGEHGKKSFAEQVEVLAKRFCPDLLEAREAFDSKPVIC